MLLRIIKDMDGLCLIGTIEHFEQNKKLPVRKLKQKNACVNLYQIVPEFMLTLDIIGNS